MAQVSFYLEFGETKMKYQDKANNTPLAELKLMAEEDFKVKDPVILYYDADEKEWLRVGKRFAIQDNEQLRVALLDEKGNIIDEYLDKKTSKEKQKVDEAIARWKDKINAVMFSKTGAQGMAFIVGMYNTAGANKDVRGMERLFEDDLDFSVVRETNLTAFELKTLVDAVADSEYGLRCKYIAFYYAGYGGTDDYGRPFLCPMSEYDVYGEALRSVVYIEEDIIRKFEKLTKRCLLFFFDQSLTSLPKQRSNPPGGLIEGLIKPKIQPMHKNSYVAYAACIGDNAKGTARYGGNWTRALCKNLREDKDFVMIMEETAYAVKEEYGQVPQRYSNLSKPVNLKATAKTHGVDPLEEPPKLDEMLEIFEDYAEQYGRIGKILKLEYRFRRKIDTDNIQYLDPQKKLEAIISEWCQRCPDVKWKTVIKYFKEDDMNKLAGEIVDFLNKRDLK